MKIILGLCSVLAFALTATVVLPAPLPSVAQPANRADELPVLVLVRHADKAAQPADDPPLTAAGAKRAQDLAAALRNAGVTAIITTQLRRTRETAQPLATALGLVPEAVSVGRRALVSNPAADALLPPEVVSERAIGPGGAAPLRCSPGGRPRLVGARPCCLAWWTAITKHMRLGLRQFVCPDLCQGKGKPHSGPLWRGYSRYGL